MKRLILIILALAALAAPSVVLAAPGLSGVYRTHIKKGPARGTWTLDFQARGRLAVSKNNRSEGTSSFSVSGATVKIGTGPGCGSSAYYHFKVTGKTLRFTRVKDSCKPRRFLFSFTYTRVS